VQPEEILGRHHMLGALDREERATLLRVAVRQ
jgi:hypothetical protein